MHSDKQSANVRVSVLQGGWNGADRNHDSAIRSDADSHDSGGDSGSGSIVVIEGSRAK